ncbi:MAG: S41 family peptidase [Bacteroidota bacterium]
MNTIKTVMRKFKKAIVVTMLFTFSFISYSFVDSYFEISKNLDIMSSLLRELNAYYVDDIKPGDLMKKGIDGMLESLDPYTEFYAESEIEDYKVMVTGQYGGIGALVRQQGDYVVIAEPYEGFPAQKAGLMAGDMLLEINGLSVKGKTTNDVSKLLKGQANTTVKVIVQREGEKSPLEKTLVREEIKIRNVPYYGMLNDSVGYIKLTGFTENAAKEVKDALVTLKDKHKMKSLILDLRGNGGGLLRESVDIVNLFVDKGQTIVTQKGKIKEMNKIYVADKSPVDTKLPLVVLVDRGSASASEIVTGAIQDLDRGVVIGQRSFGKGLVQQTVQLVYNTQMKVTIAKYYTPSGRCIQALDYFHKNPDGSVDKVPDSLMVEFKTKGGRSVYDGSGIYPDLLLEAKKYSSITSALNAKGILFDYATQYRLAHPSLASPRDFKLTDAEYNAFVQYVMGKDFDYTTKSEKALDDFRDIAEKEKYFDNLKAEFEALKKKTSHNKQEDLLKFRNEISELLEQEIASRYYYQNGRLETGFDTDAELIKAISVLRDQSLYSSIIKGEGEYKVIGKPRSTGKKEDTKKGDNPPSSTQPENKDKKPGKKG